jgi:hypothetical protein
MTCVLRATSMIDTTKGTPLCDMSLTTACCKYIVLVCVCVCMCMCVCVCICVCVCVFVCVCICVCVLTPYGICRDGVMIILSVIGNPKVGRTTSQETVQKVPKSCPKLRMTTSDLDAYHT